MQEAYIDIQDIPTHIMCWGKWVEESLGDTKEIVICITGNPGLPGFYTKFLSTIHETVNKDIPVWVIGHVGHDEPPSNSLKKVPALKGAEEVFNLRGQIEHKVNFIRKYVPSDVKIHLIGHSIGAWLILELLKNQEIKQKVHQCYLLFPTIERMAISRNGFYLTKLVAPVFFICKLFYIFFEMLPLTLRTLIVYLYLIITSTPTYFLETALKYAKLSVVEKVFFLALDEMNKVKELDVETIEANKSRLMLYYGSSDGWVPVEYCHDLKKKIKDIDAVICTRGFEHAFVIKSSVEMGVLVGQWILEKKYKKLV